MRVISFFKSDFTKNSLTLSFGTAIAQIIPFLSLLYFARVFSEADFGVFSLFLQFTVVLASVANGRLEQPLLVEKDNIKAASIFFAGVTFCLLFSLFIFLIILTLIFIPEKFNFLRILNNSAFQLPVSIFFGGIIVLFTYLVNRWKAYFAIAKGKIIQSISSNLIPFICLFFWKPSSSLLINGFLLGQVSLIIYFLYPAFNKETPLNRFLAQGYKFSFRQILIRYREFPAINMPFLLVDQLAAAIPLVFIAYFYGESAAGQAGLAFRSMLLPVALISGAVAQVYYKKAIDTVHENQSLRKLVLKVFFGLMIIGLFFFLPIAFLAPQIIPWFFGSKWGEAGFIMVALSVSMIIKFPVSPLGNTFIVARRIKVQALWQISLLICNFLLVVLTFYFKFKLISYIWFLVVLDLIMYSIYFLLILKVSGSSKIKN